MAKEARELEAFFKSKGFLDLAGTMNLVAGVADARGLHHLPRATQVPQLGTESQLLQQTPQVQVQTELGLTPEQVASNPDQIIEGVRAYVGPLVHRDSQGKIVPIFELLKDVPQIYTAEGRRIPRWKLEIGDKFKTADELAEAVQKTIANDGTPMKVSNWARATMRTGTFAKFLKAGPKTVDLIMLEVRDLGYPRGGTTKQVLDRGVELSLDKGDPRVASYQRMADRDQSMNTRYWIAMDPITDSDGNPRVFGLGRGEDGVWLNSDWAGPDDGWDPEDRIVFSFRK